MTKRNRAEDNLMQCTPSPSQSLPIASNRATLWSTDSTRLAWRTFLAPKQPPQTLNRFIRHYLGRLGVSKNVVECAPCGEENRGAVKVTWSQSFGVWGRAIGENIHLAGNGTGPKQLRIIEAKVGYGTVGIAVSSTESLVVRRNSY